MLMCFVWVCVLVSLISSVVCLVFVRLMLYVMIVVFLCVKVSVV